MEDLEIIGLYWKRDEAAISETAKKYGAFCHRIAGNILTLKEDAEECVSDTYYQAWESIPPARPEKLRAVFLNLWLSTLSPGDRILFIRRYWRGDPVKELAGEEGETPARTAKRLYRLRQNLKTKLEKEGYSL